MATAKMQPLESEAIIDYFCDYEAQIKRSHNQMLKELLIEIEQRFAELDGINHYTIGQRVALDEQRTAVRQAFADRGIRMTTV